MPTPTRHNPQLLLIPGNRRYLDSNAPSQSPSCKSSPTLCSTVAFLRSVTNNCGPTLAHDGHGTNTSLAPSPQTKSKTGSRPTDALRSSLLRPIHSSSRSVGAIFPPPSRARVAFLHSSYPSPRTVNGDRLVRGTSPSLSLSISIRVSRSSVAEIRPDLPVSHPSIHPPPGLVVFPVNTSTLSSLGTHSTRHKSIT